jgi:hypothetical protein
MIISERFWKSLKYWIKILRLHISLYMPISLVISCQQKQKKMNNLFYKIKMNFCNQFYLDLDLNFFQ